MLSKKNLGRMLIGAATLACMLETPAHADIELGINAGTLGSMKAVCLDQFTLKVATSSTECTGAALTVPELEIGSNSSYVNFNASNGATNFNSTTVQFNSSTVAFGGGTATFNNDVSFVGSSVTFDTTADFNDAITTAGISNQGNIATSSITTGTATFSTSLTVGGSATVNLGGNRVQGVAAGTAATDAVNVAQLNAATSGVTTRVETLEAVAVFHDLEITAVQEVNATQDTRLTAVEGVNVTQAAQITALEGTTANQASQIINLQTGLAQTNDDLAAETAARISADNALDTRVDALEAVTANLDERFDDVAHRSDAGTATAVALSGAMFMPGKTFNLTGNVGTYRGAVAGALQLGVVVSDMVALNAGVAKGLNKHGKTAARVGFTVGW